MKKSLYALSLLITITFFSCETDIDVNAEYKDIPVVYAVISPLDSNHYIKINKAFLGETNALDLAADANNFNYADGDLDITIDEYSQNGTKVNTYSTGAGTVVRTVNEVPKDAGIFDNSTNVLYKFVEPSISRNNTYKLKIINTTLDNKEITAETEIVDDIIISNPPNSNGKFQFWIGSVSTGNSNDKIIGVTTGADIGRVEAVLVFNYYDIYTLASAKDSVARRIVMPLGETVTSTSLGGESIEWVLDGETFFGNLESVPNPSADLSHRRLDNISLEFNIAGSELSTFMSVSAPSNTVNQDKPNYTNITNGIGIFSSREKKEWVSSIQPLISNQVNIQNSTIEYLSTHSSLSAKRFCFGYVGVGFPVAPCTQQ